MDRTILIERLDLGLASGLLALARFVLGRPRDRLAQDYQQDALVLVTARRAALVAAANRTPRQSEP